MTHAIRAIYENGVFKPLDAPNLSEHEQVRLTIETVAPSAGKNGTGQTTDDDKKDPLAGVRSATGISDLAENFDDYRFGERSL